MTFREFMITMLTSMGMSDTDSNNLMDEYIQSRSVESKQVRWNESRDYYPEGIERTIWINLKEFAVGWIKTNNPNVWYLPLFEVKKVKQGRTIEDVKQEVITLNHNDLIVYVTSGEFLVVDKEQVVRLGSPVETANGNEYKVSNIDQNGRVYVR